MSDELVKLPGSDDQPASDQSTEEQPTRTGRRSVRMFLLGRADDVEETIAELHTKQFCEAGLWSKPLQFSETQHPFVLYPGEVMRVYKRYINR